jgi:hypothetical protein
MREKHRLMVYENTLRAKCLGLHHEGETQTDGV